MLQLQWPRHLLPGIFSEFLRTVLALVYHYNIFWYYKRCSFWIVGHDRDTCQCDNIGKIVIPWSHHCWANCNKGTVTRMKDECFEKYGQSHSNCLRICKIFNLPNVSHKHINGWKARIKSQISYNCKQKRSQTVSNDWKPAANNCKKLPRMYYSAKIHIFWYLKVTNSFINRIEWCLRSMHD